MVQGLELFAVARGKAGMRGIAIGAIQKLLASLDSQSLKTHPLLMAPLYDLWRKGDSRRQRSGKDDRRPGKDARSPKLT